MKKIFMIIVGSVLLGCGLPWLAEAAGIIYDSAIPERDAFFSPVSATLAIFPEEGGFVEDTEKIPPGLHDRMPAIIEFGDMSERYDLSPFYWLRSKGYQDSSDFIESAAYLEKYEGKSPVVFASLCSDENTFNVKSLWRIEEDAKSLTIYDTLQIFLLGMACLIGLPDRNVHEKKRRRNSKEGKRKVGGRCGVSSSTPSTN